MSNNSADYCKFKRPLIDGMDIELYGLINSAGYIIRDGNNVYPVNMTVDMNPPPFFEVCGIKCLFSCSKE